MAFQFVPEFPIGTANNACVTCHVQRRDEDRLIDLGFSVDWDMDEHIGGVPQIREGWAIMCETCAKEIAHMLGYTTEDISTQLAAMRHEIGTLRQENQHLKAIKDAVQKVSA